MPSESEIQPLPKPDKDWTVTTHFHFYKPVHGAAHWALLWDVNLDKLDMLLERQHRIIGELKTQIRDAESVIAKLDEQIAALYLQLNPPPIEARERDEEPTGD